jgi:hypothetical protein
MEGDMKKQDIQGRDPEDPQLTAEIEALLLETAAAWNSQDFTRWIALWDADDTRPFYLAAEEDDFFVRREQLHKYVDPDSPATKIAQGIRVGFSNIRARRLTDDLAFAAYHMRSEMKLAFVDKPFISILRATSVLRRKPEGWRYICYTEAFQSPTMYFQKLIQNAVPEDYPEFFEKVMGRKMNDRSG